MTESITVAVLVGTIRVGRESIKAARYVAEFGRKLQNVEIILADPKDFNFPGDGREPTEKDARYSEITACADAFFIVTPEYNHSFPGSLKRMLDSEFDNYKRKPVALAGVSNGSWGGVRACEALLPVCHRLGLINIQPEVYFPRVQDNFDSSGNLKAELHEQYGKSVGLAYDELIWMAKALKF